MSLVVFKHRQTLPENPDIGTFYWIDKEDNTSELWFGSRNGLIRLDNEEIISRISDIENEIESIQSVIEDEVNNKLTWKIL
jgi:ligand-binding sensor domain-containing protein